MLDSQTKTEPWKNMVNFPFKKIVSNFSNISSEKDLENFIKERSAHVTQNTLYGYLKTRMGHKYTIMVEDEEFSKSINLASGVFGPTECLLK